MMQTRKYYCEYIYCLYIGKRKLSSWCLVMVERLFLAVLRGCLRFVIVVFPDHTHLLFSVENITFYLWKSVQNIKNSS